MSYRTFMREYLVNCLQAGNCLSVVITDDNDKQIDAYHLEYTSVKYDSTKDQILYTSPGNHRPCLLVSLDYHEIERGLDDTLIIYYFTFSKVKKIHLKVI